MAKSGKDKADGRSALEAALRAYEAGDVVTARRTARRVIVAPTPEDNVAAKRVGKHLRGDGSDAEAPAEILAQEIVDRGSPLVRPYLWAVGGLTAYALLLVLALVRYG